MNFSRTGIFLTLIFSVSSHAAAPICADEGFRKEAAKTEPPDVALARRAMMSGARRGLPAPEAKRITASVRGKKVALDFEVHKALAQPSRGTVVHLCGGPGIPCTASGRPSNVPPDVDVVLFDYLGIGKNERPEFSPEMKSIEGQAEAVTAIVSSLKPKNYVIYGHSFGTTVATVAASQISKSSTVKPRAIFFEGVVGKSGLKHYAADLPVVAERAWARLSKSDRAKFEARHAEFAKRLGPDSLGAIDNFFRDAIYKGIGPATDALRAFGNEPYDQMRAVIFPFFTMGIRPEQMRGAYASQALYDAAGCQIFRKGEVLKDTKIFGGRVSYRHEMAEWQKEQCACATVPRPYDSAQHQIKDIPLLYLNGDADWTTSVTEARYHFDRQGQTDKKLFLTAKDGGHWETLFGPASLCSGEIFSELMSGQLDGLRGKEAEFTRGQCASARELGPPPRTSQ